MSQIPDKDRRIFEKFIFLPMGLTVLNQDLIRIKQGNFKLKKPYIYLIEQTISKIQQDLSIIKKEMNKRKMKVFEEGRDEAFSQYLFVFNGYEERHNYFNPRIRNNVEMILVEYLFQKKDIP